MGRVDTGINLRIYLIITLRRACLLTLTTLVILCWYIDTSAMGQLQWLLASYCFNSRHKFLNVWTSRRRPEVSTVIQKVPFSFVSITIGSLIFIIKFWSIFPHFISYFFSIFLVFLVFCVWCFKWIR